VLAEHGLSVPVIGVAADGTGFGTDDAIWGCEIMIADLTDFKRLAHLAYLPLPGGEQAVRQPWRMAATYLAQAYGEAFLELDLPFVYQLDRAKWHGLSQMIARNMNSPRTSSLGRLFDAVAALVGLSGEVLYEGQAAIELEMLAQSGPDGNRGRKTREHYPFVIEDQDLTTFNLAPMMRAIVNDLQRCLPPSQIASRFHLTIAELLAMASAKARQQTGLHRVALSGGVFQNRLLLETLLVRLEEMDFQVYINRRMPPNENTCQIPGYSYGFLTGWAQRKCCDSTRNRKTHGFTDACPGRWQWRC
jgi:hydrogenase maturation protein HypF